MYAPKGNETHLYVRDLPGTADELYIYKLFSPIGAWAIAFVRRNATSQLLATDKLLVQTDLHSALRIIGLGPKGATRISDDPA